MPALAAAWLITKKREYADHAIAHLRAWFVTPNTRMNSNLEYSRPFTVSAPDVASGIIDTVHLVEVAQAALVLERAGMLAINELA